MKVLGSEVGSGWFRVGSDMVHGEITWIFEWKCLVPRLVQVVSELAPHDRSILEGDLRATI